MNTIYELISSGKNNGNTFSPSTSSEVSITYIEDSNQYMLIPTSSASTETSIVFAEGQNGEFLISPYDPYEEEARTFNIEDIFSENSDFTEDSVLGQNYKFCFQSSTMETLEELSKNSFYGLDELIIHIVDILEEHPQVPVFNTTCHSWQTRATTPEDIVYLLERLSQNFQIQKIIHFLETELSTFDFHEIMKLGSSAIIEKLSDLMQDEIEED